MIKASLIRLRILAFLLSFFSFFYLFAPLALGDTCSPTFPATTCSNSQTVDVTASVLASSATFTGYSSPFSVITFQEDGNALDTVVADSTGAFSKTIYLDPGVHTITAFAVDNQGLATPKITFANINVDLHADTPINNILLPPTITLSKASISIGQTVVASGQGVPSSEVTVFLNGKKVGTALTDTTGKWGFEISALYSVGNNNVYATVNHAGQGDSESSNTVSFNLVECAAGSSKCNPVVAPSNPANTAAGQTPITEKKNYNVDLKVGLDFGKNLTWIILTSIFTFQFLLLILFILIFLWWNRRRKKKKEVLEELEEKVERDLKLDHTQERVQKDFWEAEKELE